MMHPRRAAWLAVVLACGGVAALAAGPSPIRKATQADRPIKWYIPPKEGPVVGNQNGWFVTPNDILPGSFTFSGAAQDATADSFQMQPSSVWGRYVYKVTRVGPADKATPGLKLRKVVSVREIHFADLPKLTAENTLLLSGVLKEISADRKTFVAEMGFKGGPVTCRLELIQCEEKGAVPDIRSMHYGPHWQHTMDVYYPKPRPARPMPVVLYIHGGGWGALDKQNAARSAGNWTKLGFAVVSLNYRFISNASEYPAMSPPVAAPLYDAARALQYLRYKSKELRLDTGRIAVTGGSAGAATTCWLAMRDDLADPTSPDPVARQSTRVTCAFPVQAQTSLDPKQMREWIPQITYGAHAFFTGDQMKTRDKAKRFEYFLAHREQILPWIREFSPYEWASADDPPTLLCYGGQKDVIPATDASNATHHPKFGERLHKQLKALGVESYYWADNVPCSNRRYQGWQGSTRFVCDKLGVALPEDKAARPAAPAKKKETTMTDGPVTGTKAGVTLKREGGRVWLEGAKELFHRHFEDSKAGRTTPWAERSDTYMYLTQMRIAGWDADYADLITVAGYGPSFAYAPRLIDKWGAHYFPPKGRDDRIAHATGCRYRWRQYKDVEEYWRALKKAIDAGQAVHGPNEEDVLFIGYVDAAKPADRKVLPVAIVFVEDDEWTWEQFAKWHSRRMVNGWFGRIEGRVEPWPARKSAVEVLEMMVRVAGGNDSRREPNDGVTWGVAGIEAYAADLADVSKSGAKEDEGGYFQGGWRGCHNVYPQMSGRPAAATYLKRVAKHFGGDASKHILAAAAEYDEATEAWRDFTGQLGRDTQAVAHVDHTTAWTTAKHRKAGAAAVARAAKHERAAVAALGEALRAIGHADGK